MKKLALTLGAVATVLTSATTFANTSGSVQISGLVQGQTCRITDNTVTHDLTLPNTRTSSLGSAGAVSLEQVNFNISLVECEANQTAGIKFDQTNVVAGQAGTLANLWAAPGAAQNVNIQLLYANQPINLAAQTDNHYQTTTGYNDTLTYQYAARYYATAQSTAGGVRSLATFRIDYK